MRTLYPVDCVSTRPSYCPVHALSLEQLNISHHWGAGALVINRYLAEENVTRAKKELAFLLKYLNHQDFRRELAVELRAPNKLSIYDRGIRLAELTFLSGNKYRVRTNIKFIEGTALGRHDEIYYVTTGSEAVFAVPARGMHSLLQKKHLQQMRARIRDVNYKEELQVAHMIAAYTSMGKDVVVIDREVGDSAPQLPGQRLDLLALQQVEGDRYRFLAIEVKLGNNPELDEEARHRVGARTGPEQLEGYVAHIDQHFNDYADCYQRNVEQKSQLGLLSSWATAPPIINDTKGLLVVVGYMGMAEDHLQKIKQEHPNLWLKTFDYRLESGDGEIKGLL